jgi:hypothetical protein
MEMNMLRSDTVGNMRALIAFRFNVSYSAITFLCGDLQTRDDLTLGDALRVPLDPVRRESTGYAVLVSVRG